MSTIVCVASGPSLKPEDVNYCRGKAKLIVVNDNYRVAPWADWHYACDYKWWELHHNASRHMASRWTRDPDAAKNFGLKWIRSEPGKGLSKDCGLIHEGENGGYQAMNLAYHFGARRILLLGYDMSGRGHWFGSHPPPLFDAADFSERLHHFNALAADLKAEGVEVINCSRQSALTCFPRSTIQECL